MNWNKYPFVRFVSALALGIALHEVLGTGLHEGWALAGLLVIFPLVMMSLNRWVKSYRLRWVHGLAAIMAFCCVGYVRACLQEPDVRPRHYRNTAGVAEWHLARVTDPPTVREKTVKVILDVEGIRLQDTLLPVSGKVMAYFQKTDEALALRYGDRLVFRAPVDDLTPPVNPEEFDYRRYLERQGITGSVYLKEDHWSVLGERKTNPLFAYSDAFRSALMEALQRCGVTDDEFGVAAAILLGYDESLPAQVRQNYVAAGAMHILCVSGMHVGIIYLLASFLLGFLGKGKRMAMVRRGILLLLIWCYALLAGLSPSIMRSALMISFVIFGELIRRKGFVLNSIAASAFVLLLVNPNHLFAMGFQLSYAAVVGIVLLQKPIYQRLYVANKLLDKVWEITTVSVAAQLSTMPFVIAYFNQFAPYFWLSNLLMTPLSFVVILSGMLLLMVSWVPGLNVVMGKLVWLSLHTMNWVVATIESLPLSLIKGLYMSDFQFGLSLLLLLLFCLLVNLRKKRMLMELLALSAVFAFSLAWRCQGIAHQSRLMVSSLRNHTAIQISSGFQNVLICDEALLLESSSVDYSLKGDWACRQLPMNPPCFVLEEDVSHGLVMKRSNLISAHGVLLAFWNPDDRANGVAKIPVDYLLVHGRQGPDLSRVLEAYRVGVLLIDGSVPRYLAEKWIKQAESFKIPYHDLREGALVLPL